MLRSAYEHPAFRKPPERQLMKADVSIRPCYPSMLADQLRARWEGECAICTSLEQKTVTAAVEEQGVHTTANGAQFFMSDNDGNRYAVEVRRI